MTQSYQSWGRYPKARHASIRPVFWGTEPLPLAPYNTRFLPYGIGRSYGDSCLNDGEGLLDCSHLDRFIAFDDKNGLLRCEGGVTLDQILKVIVPRAWFLPVTPGTKFVTVGGAIANDVHGKNHHRHGTFGCHVTALELLRSNGERMLCTPSFNADMFKATVGGLGLTGVIVWAEFKLKPIRSSFIQQELIRYDSLEEFFSLSAASDQGYEYIVSWIDSLGQGRNLGRGIFFRGNFDLVESGPLIAHQDAGLLRMPMDAPSFVLNKWTVKLFNTGMFWSHIKKSSKSKVHYDPFFYPLDAVLDWNRMYGKRGFLQYQCLVPCDGDDRPIREVLTRIARSGQGSFLVVMKTCGDIASPGMLSFPRKGVTLAMDFPMRGTKTLQLMESLDDVVRECGGTLYPAKDARMSAKSFQQFYPQWNEFSRFIDPMFSSSFWRRVTKNK